MQGVLLIDHTIMLGASGGTRNGSRIGDAAETLPGDSRHSWQLSFGGDRVTLRGKTCDGREIAVEGKRGE
jgi:hypothetical protein